MLRPHSRLAQPVFGLITALVLTPVAGFGQSGPITLDFLPPSIAPRDVCNILPELEGAEIPTLEGDDEELKDIDRVRFLRRDIRTHMAEDPIGFFEFIDALLVRRADIDEKFSEIDATFARIDLMLRAGREDTLREAGLIDGLRDAVPDMTSGQRVQLARLYTDGIGVTPDLAFAQVLLREAAYGGNALALLEIAQLENQGTLVEGWDAPLDLTITMAFGGILGTLDTGVCRRAERIAQEYINGDIVAANPALALAWFRFAADMGGADASWRLVEHHLNADAAEKDNVELRRYLEQAVRLGVSVDEGTAAKLVSSGAIDEPDLQTILGFNHSQDARRTSAAIAPLLELVVNIDELEPDEDGLYLQYLREIVQMPEAPGRVYDRLAGEIMIRKGRWAGEAEAMALLEQAVARGDGNAQHRLAQMLMRYRDEPAQVARAESLLMEVVSRHGMAQGMRSLDWLYRCQVNDAPRLTQADQWQAAYFASGHASVSISANDLLALSPDRSPEAIAKIQSLALDGRIQMVASQAQRMQANPLAAAATLRYWAQVVNRSDQTLEAFAELEFELATTPAERDLAIEIFRRIYLNNGVTTALDLAIALVEYNARDPQVADEIEHLLTMAGNRGEGGAIRLLSRLQADVRSEAEVYAQFADAIEARGDFLAMMFAIPHIAPTQVDDYIDRAVSLMNCGTKDADELGDAYAIRGDGALSHHWREVGLHFDGGHVLSKLRLSNRQVRWFDDGAAPDPVARALTDLAAGDPAARMRLVNLTADANLPTYDIEAAVTHVLAAVNGEDAADITNIARIYRSTSEELRAALDGKIDLNQILKTTAQSGDMDAAHALGLRLRDNAEGADDLTQSLEWLEAAAARGHRDAMYQVGYALGFGLGRPADLVGAVEWLNQAAGLGHSEAERLAKTLRIAGGF